MIEAADAVEPGDAGETAIKAGAQDATGLAHKVRLAMAALRSGQKR